MNKMRAISIVAISIAASACIFVPASAAPSDIETCDRLAAHPDDPDKPANIKGSYDIAEPDIPAAMKACKTAAEAHDAPRRIWFELGRAYEFNRQPAEAVSAYRKAVEAGSTTAMVGLGALYANGNGVKADLGEARRLFERAGAAGDPLGMTNLGSMYGAGIGVPVDFAKARVWFAKAVAANSADAMFQLGLMTQDGDGGPKDDVAAKALFEKAAALGHSGALERMGAYAEAGRAGPKDPKAAIAFYKKAAALGDEDAMAALKRVHSRSRTRTATPPAASASMARTDQQMLCRAEARIAIAGAALISVSFVCTGAGRTFESSYTSIAEAQCRKFDVVKIDDAEYGASRVCAGRGGYKVFINEQDLRETLTVGRTIKQAGKEPAAHDHYGAFNHYEDKIEWRSGKDGTPYALIAGWSFADNENVDPAGRPNSARLLVVFRLPPGPVCKVAYFDRAANSDADALARTAADEIARDFKCATDKVRVIGTRGPAISHMAPPP
jgi:tetratricopeptide (TPR) repeat protein